MKCYFGCDKEAVVQLDNGNWVCNRIVNRCPVNRKKISDKVRLHHNNISNRNKVENKIKMGTCKCCICGEQAKYIVYRAKDGYIGCCEESISKCGKYREYRSKIKKQTYVKNKGYRQRLALALVEAQNRPEVVKAKSESMKYLHRKDDVYQKNYAKGRDKFRKLVKKLVDKGTHWSGPGNSTAIKHIILYKTHRKSACEHCGATRQLINHIYPATSLHLHCINKNYDDQSYGNWLTLCPLCHKKEEEKSNNNGGFMI
jgi:hypothetical protein